MSELAKALVKVQQHVTSVGKDGKGYGYTYATLGKVIESLFPIITENGLAVIQPLDNINGEPAIRTVIMHEAGESIVSVFPLAKAGMSKANDAQQIGAAITYMRRYGLCAAFGLITEDDDAACLTERPAAKQAAPDVTPSGGTGSHIKQALTDRAKAMGTIPAQVLKVLDALNDMDSITAKCAEYKSMAHKEGWGTGLLKYWEKRDKEFKDLQREVFGE